MKPSDGWKGTLSRLLKTVATKVGNSPTNENAPIVETPELYLKLTTKCMKRMSKMLSSAPKFNQEQCKYLVNKLHVALESAHSITELISTSAGSFEIIKLLFSMGLEVENFIQNCYEDRWIQSTLMLANVSKHIGSIGFNLEFCSIIFSEWKLGGCRSFTKIEITNLYQIEASMVKEKAAFDKEKLCENLANVDPNSSQGQLATFVLERLRSTRLQPGVGSPTMHEFTHFEMSMRSLKQMESLGKGVSAIVYRSNWLGVEVAKKTFDGPCNPDFLQEVSILAALSHPNIVSLLWYMVDQRKSHIIMELMDGDLHTLMQTRLEENGNNGCPFSISEALNLMLQTAEGMLFLHEMKIVHRDLKSSNILVKRGKASDSSFEYVQAKVADFGLSRTKELSMTYSQQTPNMGTTRWMAPEMIKLGDDDSQAKKEALKYPFKSDVYSFGMVCFEILTGDLLFSSMTNSELKRVVLSGGRPQLPDKCPSKLKTLIEACWSLEASSRPHFGDICAELRHLICHLSTFPGAREYLLAEVVAATENFKKVIKRNVVGRMYYGRFPNGRDLEVKVFHSLQRNFSLELDVLSRVHHKHLVALVGYCQTDDQRMLIYEYLDMGSLRDHLNGHYGVLEWKTRLNIALQAAQGLEYLHTQCNPKLIHGDVNMGNIFITSQFEAKVGEVGRAYTVDEKDVVKVTLFHRTMEIVDPEYLSTGYLSFKSDVYGFGAVLLELLTGRHPDSCTFFFLKHMDIQDKVQRCLEQGYIDSVVRDSHSNHDTLWKVLEIALQSLEPKSLHRPTMSEVVKVLHGAVALEYRAINKEK